jgi:type III secretion YscU/HrpY family protein
MAGSTGEKTEAPTPKRVRDARRKGQVAKSQDLTQALALLAVAGVLSTTADASLERLSGLTTGYLSLATDHEVLRPDHVMGILLDAGSVGAVVLGPVLVVAALVGALATFAQVGPLFAAEPLQPKLERIDPVKGFKSKLFSSRTWMELAKSAVKIGVIATVVIAMFRSRMDLVASVSWGDIEHLHLVARELVLRPTYAVAGVLLAVGVVDLVYQRWHHVKGLRMSKQDVKREHKSDEGDPEVKGQRKQMHRDIASSGGPTAAARASVVLTNPTRLAVALRYEPGSDAPPAIVARGRGEVARRIVREARRHGVPVMRNVPLSRALHPVEVGDQVPEVLWTAVAEVLLWVREEHGDPSSPAFAMIKGDRAEARGRPRPSVPAPRRFNGEA